MILNLIAELPFLYHNLKNSRNKAEIVEAHRHGLNVHRIAEIFRERGVDISKIHLMRAIRRFIEEEGRAGEGLVKSEK